MIQQACILAGDKMHGKRKENKKQWAMSQFSFFKVMNLKVKDYRNITDLTTFIIYRLATIKVK